MNTPTLLLLEGARSLFSWWEDVSLTSESGVCNSLESEKSKSTSQRSDRWDHPSLMSPNEHTNRNLTERQKVEADTLERQSNWSRWTWADIYQEIQWNWSVLYVSEHLQLTDAPRLQNNVFTHQVLFQVFSLSAILTHLLSASFPTSWTAQGATTALGRAHSSMFYLPVKTFLDPAPSVHQVNGSLEVWAKSWADCWEWAGAQNEVLTRKEHVVFWSDRSDLLPVVTLSLATSHFSEKSVVYDLSFWLAGFLSSCAEMICFDPVDIEQLTSYWLLTASDFDKELIWSILRPSLWSYWWRRQ